MGELREYKFQQTVTMEGFVKAHSIDEAEAMTDNFLANKLQHHTDVVILSEGENFSIEEVK